MSYTKHNYKKGDELLASQLNDMDDQIALNEQTADTLVTVSNTQPSAAKNRVWVKATPSEIEIPTMEDHNELSRHFNDLVLDNYVWTNPENWLNPNGFKAGNINAYNGREEEYAGRCHTDYFIPVEPGKTIYLNRMDNGAGLYMRGFVAYNSNQEFMSGGTGASAMTYTVPANCYYVKINVDGTPPIATTTKPMIYIGDSAPTVYSEYFDPHYVIETNFVNPETEELLEKLVSGQLTTLDIKHDYHCSFPRNRLRMTVGIPETFYYFSAVTPYKTTYGSLGAGVQFSTLGNDCTIFGNASAYHGNNGYSWYMYDATLALIDSFVGAGAGAPRTWLAENLQNCSLLAIGDSTVDQDYMTQGLLDHFTAQGATITLLGTLGSGLNRNEGRAGWKATDYLTDRQYGGVTNPFYNPTTQTFDFSYYMTNQGYTAPDFVVLQLGLNDLGTETNEEIWAAIKTMIDSIIAYNAAIKIILNLPSTPNQDQEKISDWLPLSTSRECSYNEYAQAHALSEYGDTKVRCSYCHLILNPATDIRDNVHPTEAGYNKMALEIANQINHWQNGN